MSPSVAQAFNLRSLAAVILMTVLSGCARPPAPPPKPLPPRLPTIVFSGDILLAGRAERLIEDKGPAAPFANVSGVLREADLAVGNLECSLSTRGEPADKKFTFRANPKSALALAEAGFDVVTLANNHAVDYGRAALSDTITAAKEAGIIIVGAGENVTAARQPVIIQAGDPPLKIALLGFSNMQPTSFYASRTRAGTNPAYPDGIREAVSAVRPHADVVIALFHWGDERSASPSSSQRQLAYLAADAGADLVVGHHPHVLQGFERRGRCLIAYSLGNFLFPSRGESRMTMLLRCTPQPNGRARIEAIPCVIDGFQPRLADGKERATCLRHLRALSAPLGGELLDAEGRAELPARPPSVDNARTPP